jgi:hypothetical protein
MYSLLSHGLWLYAQCVDYLLLVSSIEREVRPITCNGGDINTNAASLQSLKVLHGNRRISAREKVRLHGTCSLLKLIRL